MRAHFGLPSVSNEEDKKDKPPITVKFEIPYFTVSGIQVRYLRMGGVRNLTQDSRLPTIRTAGGHHDRPIPHITHQQFMAGVTHNIGQQEV